MLKIILWLIASPFLFALSYFAVRFWIVFWRTLRSEVTRGIALAKEGKKWEPKTEAEWAEWWADKRNEII